MKAIILDQRSDESSWCYFCRVSLADYVGSLPDTYQEYEIQREIVSNVYLDNLIDTVLRRGHIPPIVLVTEKNNYREHNGTLTIDRFKILDGLQRTFRLKAIRDTIDLYNEQIVGTQALGGLNKYRLSRTFSKRLSEINSTTDILAAIIRKSEESGREEVQDSLSQNNQWFEIWAGLTPHEEVQKMLVLNAGHKPVKIRHQLELLFLNILPDLKRGASQSFTLLREKDVSATTFSKNRQTGEFHFAHVITALLSISEGKPVITTTGLIQSIQTSDYGIERYEDFTSFEFLRGFVASLVAVDTELFRQYGDLGALWFGREVVLAGIFGAVGEASRENNVSPAESMDHFLALVKDNPKMLKLEQFENERNNMDLSKVNIGIANRRAVFNAVRQLLRATTVEPIDWHRFFGGIE